MKQNQNKKLLSAPYLLCGFLIGAANTMPGLSGGSVAFLLGVYEKLMKSLASITVIAILSFTDPTSRQKTIDNLNVPFLLPILLGSLLGIAFFSAFIPFFIDHYPHHMNALFLGLMITAIPQTLLELKQRPKVIHLLVMISFASATFFITTMKHTFAIHTISFQFICGACAIMAMLLPGISGSFVLVLFGNYRYVFSQINQLFFFDINAVINLMPFALGVLLGGLLFVKLINFCLTHFKHITLAALLGMIIGSLHVLWPFFDASHKKTWPAAMGIDEYGIVIIFLLSISLTFFLSKMISARQ